MMTSDTPDACEFCGAKLDALDAWECGTYWRDHVGMVRSEVCKELVELRPKAVAYDRLEQMVQDCEQLCFDRTAPGLAIQRRWFNRSENEVLVMSTDLASSIEAAWGMFKGEKT